GFTLVRKILLAVLPTFEPHHYQLDGICKVFDGIDLVAVIPTGSGKTAYLFLTIIVMIAISKAPALCPAVHFPIDPAIIVVCPTSSIEQQMDENMAKISVAALTINADTVAAARIRSADLWIRARTGIAMLILGPEQLILQGFRDLLAFEPFYNCVCALGVDEIHLLVRWGLIFRKAFLQIGYMRARLRPGIPVIGLTATLLADLMIQNTIFAFLGVNRGEFYLIRRSNARHDIRILFRQLYSGIDGRVFPEIAWVLDGSDKTLIFGNTISLVHRLKTYLNGLLPNDPDRDVRIHTHTGLNWPDDKLATLTDIANDPKCQIILATNGLAQGNDIRVIKIDIQIGEPESVEMYVQKSGRARLGIQNPRAIFYISSNHMELAAKIVQQSDVENDADAKKAGSSVTRMSRPTAEILTAKCKPVEQDHQFDNPPSNSPCLCKTCTANPLAPRPAHCLCSG
ncbi:P-loop containing nucleoside triphosphate hydrolase protein, partial [Mycena rosella]